MRWWTPSMPLHGRWAGAHRRPETLVIVGVLALIVICFSVVEVVDVFSDSGNDAGGRAQHHADAERASAFNAAPALDSADGISTGRKGEHKLSKVSSKFGAGSRLKSNGGRLGGSTNSIGRGSASVGTGAGGGAAPGDVANVDGDGGVGVNGMGAHAGHVLGSLLRVPPPNTGSLAGERLRKKIQAQNTMNSFMHANGQASAAALANLARHLGGVTMVDAQGEADGSELEKLEQQQLFLLQQEQQEQQIQGGNIQLSRSKGQGMQRYSLQEGDGDLLGNNNNNNNNNNLAVDNKGVMANLIDSGSDAGLAALGGLTGIGMGRVGAISVGDSMVGFEADPIEDNDVVERDWEYEKLLAPLNKKRSRTQSDLELHAIPSSAKPLTILLYTPPVETHAARHRPQHDPNHQAFPNLSKFPEAFSGCEDCTGKCRFVSNRDDSSDFTADAWVLMEHNMPPLHELRRLRGRAGRRMKWVYYNMDSPVETPFLPEAKRLLFNATMSYRLDSDVMETYGFALHESSDGGNVGTLPSSSSAGSMAGMQRRLQQHPPVAHTDADGAGAGAGAGAGDDTASLKAQIIRRHFQRKSKASAKTMLSSPNPHSEAAEEKAEAKKTKLFDFLHRHLQEARPAADLPVEVPTGEKQQQQQHEGQRVAREEALSSSSPLSPVSSFSSLSSRAAPISPSPRRRMWGSERSKGALFVAPTCSSDRQNVAKRLQDLFPVDSFGPCSDSGLPLPAARDEMLQHYKFYLAFEDTFCPDYVTREYWGALGKTVPVVMGTPTVNSLIPGSYIRVEDFESLEALAAYLHLVSENEELYNSFFDWMNSYRVVPFYSDQHWACRLCRYLHNTRDTMHIVDLHQAFPPDTCKVPPIARDASCVRWWAKRIVRWVRSFF